MKIIRSEENKTTLWSGGKTNEIFIYPENANFSSGDFQMRISTATVETEKSNFTTLPGVKRILTVLEGSLKLIHEGHHTVDLKPYEQDSFLGDWNTSSEGKVVDFNVMTKGNSHAEVKVLHLENGELDIILNGELIVLFLAEGNMLTKDSNLKKGDALVLSKSVKLAIDNRAKVIQVSFWP